MATQPAVAFRPLYLRWLIVIAVLIVAFLALLGVLPSDPKFIWLCFIGLCVALAVP